MINANARLYSPYLGRFVSPDPLLNSEGGPLLYNPYVYANNNPFKYIDRNGEFIIFPVLSLLQYFLGNDAAVIGCSVVATALSIGVGVYVGSVVTAGVGALGVSVGSPFIAGAAPFVGAAAGAAAGNLTYNLSYSALTGTPFNFSWKDMGIEMGIAVATVGVCTVASKLASKSSKIMQTRHRPKVTNPDEMAAFAEADEGLSQLAAPEMAKETGMQARQSSAAMHSNAGLLERTGKSVTTFTGEVYINKNDPHYLELLKEAQARYPNKAGHIQMHHVDPKYMGGPSNGKLIPLDAAYHQMITNEFRNNYPYGLPKLDESVRRGFMQKVYMKYPLPQ